MSNLLYIFCISLIIISQPVNSTGKFIDKQATNDDVSTKTVPSKSVLLRAIGGLGNQLFKFACSYSLAKKHRRPLFVYVPFIENNPENRSFAANDRQFVLDYFHVDRYATMIDETWKFATTKPTNIPDDNLLSQDYNSSAPIFQHVDYCQSQAFFAPFKNHVVDAFQIKIELLQSSTVSKWIHQINSTPVSVAVHIRHGDFSPMIRIPTIFYQKAVKDMIAKLAPVKPTFFIFTDEFNRRLLQQEFDFLFNADKITTHVVSNPTSTNSLQEFYLMSSCRHQIIPNSSFGWWAAYLNRNKDKIVIAAHHNPRLFDALHGRDSKVALYHRLQYRYLYYPQEWFVSDLFNETVF